MAKVFKVAFCRGRHRAGVMAEALKVLERRGEEIRRNVGADPCQCRCAGIDNEGKALPDTTVNICKPRTRFSSAPSRPEMGNPSSDEQPERGALLPLRKYSASMRTEAGHHLPLPHWRFRR